MLTSTVNADSESLVPFPFWNSNLFLYIIIVFFVKTFYLISDKFLGYFIYSREKCYRTIFQEVFRYPILNTAFTNPFFNSSCKRLDFTPLFVQLDVAIVMSSPKYLTIILHNYVSHHYNFYYLSFRPFNFI